MASWFTEYLGLDGHRYAGPMVLADSQVFADALTNTCLRGPEGQSLRVTGEVLAQETLIESQDTRTTIRLVSSN